jgi:signal transduction histidine kinase
LPKAAQAPGGEALLELLTEGLLHDARNPLNALSISLEVLADRSGETAQLSAIHERSIRSMREQIARINTLLTRFGEFVVSGAAPEPVDLSAVAHQALEVIGHHARCRRVQLRASTEPDLIASAGTPGPRRWLLEQLVLAIASGNLCREVVVSARAEPPEAVLRITNVDNPGGAAELRLPLV